MLISGESSLNASWPSYERERIFIHVQTELKSRSTTSLCATDLGAEAAGTGGAGGASCGRS